MSSTLLAFALPVEESPPEEAAPPTDRERTKACPLADCEALRALPPRSKHARVGDLPTWPVWLAFENERAAYEKRLAGLPSFEGRSGAMRDICIRAQTKERVATRWRSGEVSTIKLDRADELLISLGWLWWEVWNERTVRIPVVRVHLRSQRIKTASLPGYSREAILAAHEGMSLGEIMWKRIERNWMLMRREGDRISMTRGYKDYGDLGVDQVTLKRIERLWEPPMDEEAKAWAAGL